MCGLPFINRVHAIGDELTGLVAPSTGLFEADSGVDAEREQLGFTPKTVSEPPPPRPGRLDKHGQPTGVGDRSRLQASLSVSESVLREWHVYNYRAFAPYLAVIPTKLYVSYTHFILAVNGLDWMH